MAEARSRDCDTSIPPGLICDLRLRSISEPGFVGFCLRVWNWREGFVSLNKWQAHGMWERISLLATAETGEYQGQAISRWIDSFNWEEVNPPNWVSSTDVFLLIRKSPNLSTLRILFTFKGEVEFDKNIFIDWKPHRVRNFSQVTVETPITIDDKWQIWHLVFFISDNTRVLPATRPASWGKTIEIGPG